LRYMDGKWDCGYDCERDYEGDDVGAVKQSIHRMMCLELCGIMCDVVARTRISYVVTWRMDGICYRRTDIGVDVVHVLVSRISYVVQYR